MKRSRQFPPCTLRQNHGFSLVELMVALMFLALLMAGMAKVYSSSVKVFKTTGETLSTQRNNTWAMNMISDDISQAGYIFPDRVLPSALTSGTELMFRIDPAQTVSGVTRISDLNSSTVENETLTADVFQFFADVPLPVTATWTTTTTGESEGSATTELASAAVTFTQGGTSDLKAGDIMVILDGAVQTLPNGTVIPSMETPMIKTAANPVVFQDDSSVLANYTPVSFQALPVRPHLAGVPLLFVRPAQLVRLSIKAVALDPAHPSVKQPCLVRQQANFPTDGTSTVTWANVASTVLAENVEGFRVDVSFDGGVNWDRTGASTWSDIVNNASAHIKSISGYTSITDRRDWFRNIPCLLRIDLTTRTPHPPAGVQRLLHVAGIPDPDPGAHDLPPEFRDRFLRQVAP